MEHKYNPVTPELVEELKKVVGDRYVKTDEEYLEQYQTDEEGNPISSRSRKWWYSPAPPKKWQKW